MLQVFNDPRISILLRTLEKTDRILTERRDVSVRMKHGAVPAPAWNDGQTIFIGETSVGVLDKRSLVSVLGLNYHEVSHILFSPRLGDDSVVRTTAMEWLYRLVQVPASKAVYNLLEDQRIETLFVARYHPAQKYFGQMVSRYLLQDQQHWNKAYLLLHGRRYLPLELRQQFKQMCTLRNLKQILEVVDIYRLLDLSKDSDVETACYCIEKLTNLLTKQNEQAPSSDCDSTELKESKPDRKVQEKSASDAKEKTEKQDKEEEDGDDGSGFWEDSDEDSDNEEEGVADGEGDDEDDSSDGVDDDDDHDDDGDSASGDDDDADDGEGTGEDDDDYNDDGDDTDDASSDSEKSEGDEGEADEGVNSVHGEREYDQEDDGDGDDESSSGDSQHGSGVGENNDRSAAVEILQDVIWDVENSSQVEQDVKSVTDTMNDPRNFDFEADSNVVEEKPVSDEAKQVSRQVQSEFGRLYAQFEAGWNYGSDNGRLNVGRVMQGFDPDEIWDEWEPGNEQDTGLEIFIALDVSGSMGAMIREACEAVWIIKNSADELEAKVTVIGFGSGTLAIVPRSKKSDPHKMNYVNRLMGSTQPYDAFVIAQEVFKNSDMPNRLFVAVTDGGWGNGSYIGSTDNERYWISRPRNQIHNPVEAVQKIDATRMYVGIGDLVASANPDVKQHFDIVADIDSPSGIVDLVRAAVTQMLNSRLNN